MQPDPTTLDRSRATAAKRIFDILYGKFDDRPGINLTDEELEKRISTRHIEIFTLATLIQQRLDDLQSDCHDRIKALNFKPGETPSPEALRALWGLVVKWRDAYKVKDQEAILDIDRADLHKLAFAVLEIVDYWEDPQEQFSSVTDHPD